MPDPLIKLDSVAVRAPGTLILRSVTLLVEPGTAVGLFGSNGSGKTTLLRTIATLLPPTAGGGTVMGATLGTDEVETVRPSIGLVAHEPALFEGLTLRENLELVARLTDEAHISADEALADVGLQGAANRRAEHCSNGMRRRAEFARLLITEPRLLLLDEAHVGLDQKAGTLVETLVEKVTANGGAVVVVSHEQHRVSQMIDRSVSLVDGMIVEGA